MIAVLGVGCLFLLILTYAVPASAADFLAVRYDPNTDEIVARMTYLGSNSWHRFSVHWGTCMDREGEAGKAIEAQVIDDQRNDARVHSYSSTTRFSLMDLHCRPAEVTLRTGQRFYYKIFVPAGPTNPRYTNAPQKGRCAPGYHHAGGSMCVPAVPPQCDHRGASGGGESSNLAHRCQ